MYSYFVSNLSLRRKSVLIHKMNKCQEFSWCEYSLYSIHIMNINHDYSKNEYLSESFATDSRHKYLLYKL